MTAGDKNGPVIRPEGKIDSGTADAFSREIESALEGAEAGPLTLDFDRVSYISSAGLRVLLKLSKRLGDGLSIVNVSPEVYDIFDMTGFTTLMHVKRRLRRLSVDGCEIIGKGANGIVYRIDEDTIVKVYRRPDALPLIEDEQKKAKQAFLMGLPTAISYDVVRVGDRFGSVFEMLKATSCNDRLLAEPEKAEDLLREYAELILRIHAIKAPEGALPDAREVYIGYLDQVSGALTEGTPARLRALLEQMPRETNVIHGDIHTSNVLFSGGEPLLIDMDTLAAGNLAFELAGLFVAYQAFNEDEPGNSQRFFGFPKATADTIWRILLETCLGPGRREETVDRIRVLGYIRYLYTVIAMKNGGEELMETRIRRAAKRLDELIARVDALSV